MTHRNTTADVKSVLDLAGSIDISDDVGSYSIDGLHPKVVAKPTSIEQVSQIMQASWESGLAVAPWGGGTRQTLGNPINRLDVALDLSGLNRVVRHNYGDLTATVEAGATLSAIQETLKAHGQFLAMDAALPQSATLGGTLASGASGPLRWQFGSPRDTVIGMKVVQPDGVVTKSGGEVVKNVSGYDMARLHIGGLGTLGVIVELSLKLTPLPRREITVLASFKNDQDCATASLSIFKSYIMPLALTSIDDEGAKRARIEQSAGSDVIAVRLGGRPRTLERQVSDVRSICTDSGAVSTETIDIDQAESFWRKIADFGWDDSTTPVLSGRISVKPSSIGEATSLLRAIQIDGLRLAAVSNVGFGTVLANWFGDTNVSTEAIATLVNRTRDVVHNVGGQIIVERCPVDAKSKFDVWDDVGAPISTMRRMKEQYDPKGILNPGRFAGGI